MRPAVALGEPEDAAVVVHGPPIGNAARAEVRFDKGLALFLNDGAGLAGRRVHLEQIELVEAARAVGHEEVIRQRIPAHVLHDAVRGEPAAARVHRRLRRPIHLDDGASRNVEQIGVEAGNDRVSRQRVRIVVQHCRRTLRLEEVHVGARLARPSCRSRCGASRATRRAPAADRASRARSSPAGSTPLAWRTRSPARRRW